MKKITQQFLVLLFFISFVSAQAQVRFLEVNPSTNQITLKNFGAQPQDISSFWFCSLFVYGQLNSLDLVSGSLLLMPQEQAVLGGFEITDAAADLGFYLTNSFASPSQMIDFVQWGAAGQGRESVAVAAGLWTAGDFLQVPGPYAYNGDGTQNGIGFWQVLSVSDFALSNLKIYPNPASDVLNLVYDGTIDISQYKIYSVDGKVVKFGTIHSNNSIIVSNLRTGFYFLKLTDTSNNSVVKRFLVN